MADLLFLPFKILGFLVFLPFRILGFVIFCRSSCCSCPEPYPDGHFDPCRHRVHPADVVGTACDAVLRAVQIRLARIRRTRVGPHSLETL